MPAVVAKGAIIIATVLAAAAVAVYESPEVRQFAEDCRRKLAIALHSLGDEINPPSGESPQEPRFNRPEDAQGFMQSTAEAGVDADEESRRRQREELMYWNQIRLEKLVQEEEGSQEYQERPKADLASFNFDKCLHTDSTDEEGTPVYNTGTDVYGDTEGGLVRRRGDGVRGLERGASFANPFTDDHVEIEKQRALDANLISPEPSEISDIYGLQDNQPTFISVEEPLVDLSEPGTQEVVVQQPEQPWNDNLYTSGVEAHPDSAFASIHAWADDSHNASFYASLPVSPTAPASEASTPDVGSGELTPTDSMSLADSNEDVGHSNASSFAECSRPYDVMSEDGEGISTPGSWTEVGSVISEASGAGHQDSS